MLCAELGCLNTAMRSQLAQAIAQLGISAPEESAMKPLEFG